jgi:histidinol dehydrogenase
MEQNTVAKPAVATDAKVMASVEAGPEETFIIADVTTDDAYLTVPLDAAASLPAWR